MHSHALTNHLSLQVQTASAENGSAKQNKKQYAVGESIRTKRIKRSDAPLSVHTHTHTCSPSTADAASVYVQAAPLMASPFEFESILKNSEQLR
jgi:hypothetical protein